MGNTFLESVALKIDLIHLLVLIVPQMCCVHFYYVTIYLCSGLFGCDVQKGKTRQNYSGQKRLPFSIILWTLALRICQSLSLIHVHLVHKHLVANNELNQSFSPEQWDPYPALCPGVLLWRWFISLDPQSGGAAGAVQRGAGEQERGGAAASHAARDPEEGDKQPAAVPGNKGEHAPGKRAPSPHTSSNSVFTSEFMQTFKTKHCLLVTS